jgi:talin
MVAAAKASVPTIQDQASAMQLSQCAKNLGTALAELRTAAQKVWQPSSCGTEGRRCPEHLGWGEARQSSL